MWGTTRLSVSPSGTSCHLPPPGETPHTPEAVQFVRHLYARNHFVVTLYTRVVRVFGDNFSSIMLLRAFGAELNASCIGLHFKPPDLVETLKIAICGYRFFSLVLISKSDCHHSGSNHLENNGNGKSGG